MKTLFFLVIALSLSFSLSAQSTDSLHLTNTKWSGIVHAPDDMDAVFYFTKDTLTLFGSSEEIIEQMSYSLRSDTLTLKKISGLSYCGDEAGVYKISITDNKLSFVSIADACDMRKGAFANPYTLIE